MNMMYLGCLPVMPRKRKNIITCEINTNIKIFSNIMIKHDVIYSLENMIYWLKLPKMAQKAISNELKPG